MTGNPDCPACSGLAEHCRRLESALARTRADLAHEKLQSATARSVDDPALLPDPDVVPEPVNAALRYVKRPALI